MKNAKEGFLRTYRAKGGAFAFWMMIIGIVGTFVLTRIVQAETAMQAFIPFIPALIALVCARQFTTMLTSAMLSIQEENQNKKD